jgi:hypothetical protein
MFPIRFDRDSIDVRYKGRWHHVPFIFMPLSLCAFAFAVYWGISSGPWWTAAIAWTFVIVLGVPYFVFLLWLFGGVIFFFSVLAAKWIIERLRTRRAR